MRIHSPGENLAWRSELTFKSTRGGRIRLNTGKLYAKNTPTDQTDYIYIHNSKLSVFAVSYFLFIPIKLNFSKNYLKINRFIPIFFIKSYKMSHSYGYLGLTTVYTFYETCWNFKRMQRIKFLPIVDLYILHFSLLSNCITHAV